MDSSGHRSEEAMNERALILDEVTTTDLRKLADRLLEATSPLAIRAQPRWRRSARPSP
jgi:hypothetical protein